MCVFLAAIFNLETELGARTSGSSFKVITGCAVPNIMSICQSHQCVGLCSASSAPEHGQIVPLQYVTLTEYRQDQGKRLWNSAL